VPLAGGTVSLLGRDLSSISRRGLAMERRHMQMIFQDPYSSLNPSMLVAECVGEPLVIHEHLSAAARDQRVADLLERVGLSRRYIDRYPYEFSGGQRQRLAIARAVALQPSLVVCDEAVSALDVSTRNQVINLLEDLQAEFGIAYLFIAHDLAVVRHIAHRVAVMYLGRIVEVGPVDRVYSQPGHPYTEALLSAIPLPDPDRSRQRNRIILQGDAPDPSFPPSGCVFHPRCPYVMDICREVTPVMTPIDSGGTAACHLHTAGPQLRGTTVLGIGKPTGMTAR
jgi:oligopeptide/dipeptide ABC transporter ATP-binding protein